MAHEKITKIRKQNFSDKKIKEMFENYDKNENGTIEFDEFKMMLGDINLELSMQEAEVLYLSIDKDMNHGLKLEEFQKFWSTSDELEASEEEEDEAEEEEALRRRRRGWW